MRKTGVSAWAVIGDGDEEEDDLFGTNDDDEDFNLFGNNNSKSKTQATQTLKKAPTISGATIATPTTPQRPANNSKGGSGSAYPFFPSALVPKPGGGGGASGLFGNSGNQNFKGLVNLTGLAQGFLNGSLVVGDNNSISLHCACN